MGKVTKIFKIDQDVVYQGKLARIADINCAIERFTILVPESNKVVRNVTANEIEPLANQCFATGDRVRSKLGGGFEGVVTAIETASNLVVCRPDTLRPSSRNDRCRWAYKPSELELMPRGITFKMNNKYIINGDKTIWMVQSPCPSEVMMAVDKSTGDILFQIDSAYVTWNTLQEAGIHQVRKLV